MFNNTLKLVFYFFFFHKCFTHWNLSVFCLYINKHNFLSVYILLEIIPTNHLSENTDPVWLKHIICSKYKMYFNILVFFFFRCVNRETFLSLSAILTILLYNNNILRFLWHRINGLIAPEKSCLL